MIKTGSSQNYTIYELLRINSGGGGLCIGVNKDLQPVWISQGDDDVECLVVEVWVNEFPIRIVNGYGPQASDSVERKQKFWDYIEREVNNAIVAGAGFILQMDGNCHVGKDIIVNDVNIQNYNGKLFNEFLERNPHLTLINSLPLCEGTITRMRKTVKGMEKSILDFFVVCDKILPYTSRMVIDEKRKNALTNYSSVKKIGRIIESDHNPIFLYLDLMFTKIKTERVEIFQFRNKEAQNLFKTLTSNTEEFTDCFENELTFDEQASKWRETLEHFFQKAFKKIRISNKPNKKQSDINQLMAKRRILKKKDLLNEKEEEELVKLEEKIALQCEEQNRKKVSDNFKALNGKDGDLSHQGIWKIKKKYFPKIKPSLPAGKLNMKKQLITNPAELKELYLQTFKFRLRQRQPQPGFEELLEDQKELCKLRAELAKEEKTQPWSMADLDTAIKSLKNGKCRDPEGLIRELFKDDVMGTNLKKSLLILYNKIKVKREFPAFIQLANICAIYKGKGSVNSLESDRGIFLVSLFRTILMKMVYKEKYPIVEESMSDSNIGARKQKNIRNHIFVVNSVIHEVLSKKSNKPIDILVLDYKQMFDSECLFECMNDVYEAGVNDDIFSLLCEANKKSLVSVQTPHGLSRREVFEDIVMQGDVLAPLISSLQEDTMGKECIEEKKHLYYFKGTVPIPPLGMVDDLFTISECGYKTNLMNQYINLKTATKRLQFGTDKCIKMHIGKAGSDILCKDCYVGNWRVDVITDPDTGICSQADSFTGNVKMKMKEDQLYLGDVISSSGSHTKNVQQRRNKGQGVVNQIMQILDSTYFGKYYFEVASVLRESLFLSSLLLNSEAWVNYTEKDIRILEQCDEMLLGKILECEANTSNALKYLELGIVPIRFEVMRRKLGFLQYILKQEKTSLIYQILEATRNNMVKNDFVQTCMKYLKTLDVNLSFEEIANLSDSRFKKILKEKMKSAAFNYLTKEKGKQKKILNIKYDKLEMQEYLLSGDRNSEISKLIFKARGLNLDIKTHKKWKYSDRLCIGCQVKEETGDEILFCESFGENMDKIAYNWFFSTNSSDQIEVAKLMKKKLKERAKLTEEIT